MGCVEEFFRCFQQGRLGAAGMSLLGEIIQGVDHAGAQTQRAVCGNAEIGGNAVSAEEADAVHLCCQPIRVAAHDFRSAAGVFGDDPGAQARSQTQPLQKNQRFPLSVAFLPGFAYFRDAFFADARDFEQPIRAGVQNPNRVNTEFFDDFISVDFADAGQDAGGQVAADAIFRGGQDSAESRHWNCRPWSLWFSQFLEPQCLVLP